MSSVVKMTDATLDRICNDAKRVGHRNAVQAIMDWCEVNIDTALDDHHYLVDVVSYGQLMDALKLMLNSK